MEQRAKPVMRRVHVEESRAERTRVVTMSGVLKGATPEEDLRVWCEEHWKVPTDSALEKELVHCAWWTTDRNRASSSFDGAMRAHDVEPQALAGSLPEGEPQMTPMAQMNCPADAGERCDGADGALAHPPQALRPSAPSVVEIQKAA